MPVSYLAFLLPAWIDRVLGPSASDSAAPPRHRRGLMLALALQFLLVATEQIARPLGRTLPLPLEAELGLAGLRQSWRMFAPDGPVVDIRWEVPGRLADGQAVDVAAAVAPALAARDGFRYSR